MNQDEKFKYGKLIYELHGQLDLANKNQDFKKETEILNRLIKLKLLNPEYFNQTIRLLK